MERKNQEGNKLTLIKDKPQINHREFRNMFVRTETPMVTCTKCNTSYPIIDGFVMCNGHKIDKCLCETKILGLNDYY